MKKIFSILALCLFLGGCDSFLEEDNRAGIDNNKLYTTAEGFETLRVNAYSRFREVFRSTPNLQLAGTDIYQKPRGMTNNGIYDYTYLYPTNSDVLTFYTNVYTTIQAINAGLNYVDIAEISETNRQLYTSEFHFMRGFLHFLLIEQFGGIVINDEYTNTARINIPRSSLSESYDFVITELTAALNGNLPQTDKTGKICKDIVNHYLGKVYLTRGWDTNSQADFNTAKTYFGNVFSSRGENLTLKFEDLWSPFHENNDEILWAIQYDETSLASSTTGNNQESLFGIYLGGSERGHKYMSTVLFPSWHVHSWFGANDARYEGTFMTTMWEYYYDYYQGKNVPGVNRISAIYPRVWDKAKAAEMEAEYKALPGYPEDLSMNDADGNIHPEAIAFIKKWCPEWANVPDDQINALNSLGNNYLRIYPFFESSDDPMVNENLWRVGFNSDFCQPVTRKFDMSKLVTFNTHQSYRDIVMASLSETMLLYAETCIALEDYAGAQTYINKVLARPGNGKDGGTLTMTLPSTSKTDALEAFLKESGKELFGQYCGRWPELRRTGMLKTMCYKYNYDFLTDPTADPIGQKLYRPIPQNAIDLNDGLSDTDQNPGY